MQMNEYDKNDAHGLAQGHLKVLDPAAWATGRSSRNVSSAARITRTTIVLPVPAPPLMTQTPQDVAMNLHALQQISGRRYDAAVRQRDVDGP